VTSSVDKRAFQPWWKSAHVTIYGAAVAPTEVRVDDGVIHDWHYDGQAHAVTLTVPDAVKNWSVRLTF